MKRFNDPLMEWIALIPLIVLGEHTEFLGRTFRCYLVDTVIELGIGVLVGAIIIGKVAIPQLIAVSTSGWDSYSVILWGVMPLICVAALGMAVIYHVKYGAWPR